MANINKFSTVSPDTFLKAGSDMAFAKFGHLNAVVDAYNTLDTSVTFGMPVEAVVTTQFDKTSDVTLANVPGLSVNVLAGATYVFRAYLPVTSAVGSGIKVGNGGTATFTNISESAMFYTAITVATATAAASGSIGGSTALVTFSIIEGTFKVNAAGTFTIQFAQNASNATACSVLINASLTVTRVS